MTLLTPTGQTVSHQPLLWHHRCMKSSGLEHLARTAYEAFRGASPTSLPPWEDTTEQEQQAWRAAAASAVAAQVSMNLAADRYKETRDVWRDFNDRQEFEHDLINRKTTWWLTGQTILFAAYGLTLKGDFVGMSDAFPKAVALTGLAVAVVTLLGVLALINSKGMSWWQYKKFYNQKKPESTSAKLNTPSTKPDSLSEKLDLPRPLNEKPLQWGVKTWNTFLTLAPDVLLPLIFAIAWLFLYRHRLR
jgi:hypothetical protein